MSSRTYVYVLIASVGSSRIPLAAFDNRERCEHAVGTELEENLAAYGFRMSDCDNFTVEEWTVNSFLSKDAVKTLTAFDREGNEERVLVPRGMEGKTSVERQGSRFRRLLENS